MDMNSWIWIYTAVFAGGAALSLLLTPLFGALARRTGFLDVPAANHKKHAGATPLLGGCAMFSSWFIGIFAGILLAGSGLFDGLSALSAVMPGMMSALPRLGVIAGGALLAVLLGLWDDKRPMSTSAKFGGQFAIALLVTCYGGVRLNVFIGDPLIAGAVTVFWIMLMMNSINFFDNMDGLAAGVIAIALGIFAVIAGLNGQFFIAANSALSCGVCCGFWFYNTAPARIFMGDSGSHFLGFLAAVTAAEISFFDISYSLSRFPVLIPVLVLALPLFDTVMVVVIRTLNRKPFWIGDHNHISHRFVRMGLTRPQAVLLVHLLSLSIGLAALPIFWGDFRTAAVLVFQSLIQLTVVTLLQFTLAKKDPV